MIVSKYSKALTAGIVFATLSMTPAFAQDANNPAVQTPPAVSNPTPAQSDNGQSTESSSEADKPGGPIADTDVFGFDISMGTANLTAEQMTAAKNTCRDNVTIDPVRYSSAVKSFCDQLK
ncbi:hypothetical protein SAMN02745157_0509 [Kaistia soli DSM 19436]|uniref:Uncharacterized protein n=1 Tax=Kaistia soli DSM 19436 TaxID=1122133 RepID=A0A1M4UQ06_9HYPH|nr:hypothetical protein [Kaistia soli]SHE58831.1 hypothetical protein SAMN02745157_0509 [Kaistia soli DSM 19436]